MLGFLWVWEFSFQCVDCHGIYRWLVFGLFYDLAKHLKINLQCTGLKCQIICEVSKIKFDDAWVSWVTDTAHNQTQSRAAWPSNRFWSLDLCYV